MNVTTYVLEKYITGQCKVLFQCIQLLINSVFVESAAERKLIFILLYWWVPNDKNN